MWPDCGRVSFLAATVSTHSELQDNCCVKYNISLTEGKGRRISCWSAVNTSSHRILSTFTRHRVIEFRLSEKKNKKQDDALNDVRRMTSNSLSSHVPDLTSQQQSSRRSTFRLRFTLPEDFSRVLRAVSAETKGSAPALDRQAD